MRTIKVGNNQVRVATGWEQWTPSESDVRMLKDAERNIHSGLWEDQVEDPPGEEEEMALPEAAEELQEPVELLPHQDDYWRYNDAGVIRVHIIPRHPLYVPQQHECPFNLDDLSDERHTYMDEQEEQPQPDNWRDSRDQQEYAQAWTGTSTLFWRRQPEEVETHGMPTGTAIMPSAALPPLAKQTPTLPPAAPAGGIHSSSQVVQQQIQQHVDQRQLTIVSSPTYQQFGAAPGAPVPHTPRRRTLRSRAPMRSKAAPATPQAIANTAQPSDPGQKQRPAIEAPMTPDIGDTNTPAEHDVPAPKTHDTTEHPANTAPVEQTEQADTIAHSAAAEATAEAEPMAHDDALPEVPAKRPYDAMFQHYVSHLFEHGERLSSQEAWMGW